MRERITASAAMKRALHHRKYVNITSVEDAQTGLRL
jgi:hypothetical protein